MAHEDVDSGETHLLLRGAPPYPPPMLKAAGFGKQPVPPFPWSPPVARSFVAPVPPLGAPGPELAVLADSVEDGKRHLRLRLTSPRGARVATLLIPAKAGLESMRVDGETVPMGGAPKPGAPRPPARGWRVITYHTLPTQGGILEVVLSSTEPNDWYLFDRTDDLPVSARGVAAARPAWAAALQDGDGTIVSRKVRI
jgi:hypothetical protein